MKIQFRYFKQSDSHKLLELFINAIQSVYPDLEAGEWTADLRDIEASYIKNGGAMLVGVSGNKIVAMGGIQSVSSSVGEMKRVAIDPNIQGQGLGQRLISMLEDTAKSLGFKKIILDTTLKQVVARHLYEKNDYKLVKREIVLHPSGSKFDTFFYEKELA